MLGRRKSNGAARRQCPYRDKVYWSVRVWPLLCRHWPLLPIHDDDDDDIIESGTKKYKRDKNSQQVECGWK